MGKFFLAIGGILAVLGVIRLILGFVQSVDEVVRYDANVGECTAHDTADEVRVLPCDDPAAWWRVVGREIRRPPATDPLINEACAPYPTATDVTWHTLVSDELLILCLEPVRR